MRCKKCGFRIRGRNHEEGEHHKLGGKLDKNGNKLAVNPNRRA